MSKSNKLGIKGEETAVVFLQQKGYKILEINWRFLHFELDIITKKDDILVFVEVKSRLHDFYESLEEAVSKKKQRHIVRAADAYIQQKDIFAETRFDIIAIIFKNEESSLCEITHLEDAFSPIINSGR